MPISGTSVNYTGRTVDISIMQGVNPNGLASITPAFGRISTFCTGIQKLVQRYTISLLTQLGSQLNYPAFGSALISRLTSSNMIFNKADVFPIFNLANASVIASFRAYQAINGGLTDEMLNTAILNDVIIDQVNNGINLKIQIYPMTSDPVVFIVPLPN